MSSRLPDFVDPWRLSDQGKRFTGELELRHMPRLAAAVSNTEGSLAFELEFGRDRQKRPRITGSIRAVLALECQRCLEPMDYPVQTELNLTVIEVDEEAKKLPDEVDPVIARDGRIGLRELLEDELLLAIPQVPRHDVEACAVDNSAMESAPDAPALQKEPAEAKNPFAVLSGLKSTDKN